MTIPMHASLGSATPRPSIALHTVALVAGCSYVVLFAAGILGNFAVRERLVVTGDAAATFENFAGATTQVRLAIAAFVVAFALDVLVAWCLFHVFRAAGGALSALAAWFRIVYTVFLGVAVVFLFAVLELVGREPHITALDGATRESDVMLALDAFNATWVVGLTCFGVHLALLGVMCLRMPIVPRLLGPVLLAAGAAYVFDTFAYTLLADYEDHEAAFTVVVAVPAVIAEAALAVWLLRTGRRRSG